MSEVGSQRSELRIANFGFGMRDVEYGLPFTVYHLPFTIYDFHDFYEFYAFCGFYDFANRPIDKFTL